MIDWRGPLAILSARLCELGQRGYAASCLSATSPDEGACAAWLARGAADTVRKSMVHLGLEAGAVVAAKAYDAAEHSWRVCTKAAAAEEASVWPEGMRASNGKDVSP